MIDPLRIFSTKLNQCEAYKNLLSIIFAPPGSLISISKNDHGSKIYKPKLHNPIENIVKIEINVDCQRLAYLQGLAYGFGNSSVYFYVLENKNSPNIDIKILVARKKSLMLLQHFLPKEQLLNVIESF